MSRLSIKPIEHTKRKAVNLIQLQAENNKKNAIMSIGTFNKVNVIEWDTKLFNVKSFLNQQNFWLCTWIEVIVILN